MTSAAPNPDTSTPAADGIDRARIKGLNLEISVLLHLVEARIMKMDSCDRMLSHQNVTDLQCAVSRAMAVEAEIMGVKPPKEG